MLRAVIDTNVVLEGLTGKGEAGRVMDAWVRRAFVPCASTSLALEYEAVLLRRFPEQRHLMVQAALQALLNRAEYIPIHFQLRPTSPDPGDDFVVECAFNARAVLVTRNTRDFARPAANLKIPLHTSTSFLALLVNQE